MPSQHPQNERSMEKPYIDSFVEGRSDFGGTALETARLKAKYGRHQPFEERKKLRESYQQLSQKLERTPSSDL